MKRFAFLLLLIAAPASAGTISGTISVQGGGALPAANVRLWSQGAKGWSILTSTTADGSGNYSFNVANGNYLVDAQGPANSNDYGDRWYDVLVPFGSGYIGEDADVIAAGNVGGVDIALEVLGGDDGFIDKPSGAGAPSIWVRMERHGDNRIEHNDFTDTTPAGQVSFRGMVPASDYQILAYDPLGVYDLLGAAGPYSVTSNVDGTIGTLTMANAPTDPNEPNNAPSCGSPTISGALLHSDPPQPWSSAGARIGPLANGDVDWYCFAAVDGDRLILDASSGFTFNGQSRANPWTDPMLSWWQGARVTKLAENDDTGGTFDSHVDTGPLTAGCYCAAVTTFGDGNYTGAGQNSTGAYTLHVAMGNRPPVPSIKKGSTEVPASPATFSINEGDTLNLNLSYVDADHTTPTTSFTHTDRTGTAVTTGALTLGSTSGTYSWTAGPTDAAGSPYTLKLTTADAEFTMTKTVILVVNAVDMPPTMPTPVSPIGGTAVATGAPALTWTASTDPENDAITYDVEVYADDPASPVAQTMSGISGTSWTPATIAENTRVYWRVRAEDAQGVLSPWSDFAQFLVDSANDPPDDPQLVKPADEETIAMRRPGLEVLNVTDPEGDPITYTFEIAADIDFANVVWTSAAVPENTVASTTMTSPDMDLDWGSEYYARVQAADDRGGVSAWSDPHHFRLKQNVPPSTPTFDGGCVNTTYTDTPPDKIVVSNVTDPEGEPITFVLDLWHFDDPMSATPIYTAMALESTTDTVTAIPIDLSALGNGHFRYTVRAYDGTDFSEPIGCDLTVDIVTMPPESPGGCCDTGSGNPAGALLLGLSVAALLVRSRRR